MKPYYEDEHVTLYHGDCLEVTEWLAADVLVTDPPYGYSHSSAGGPRGWATWRNTQIQNDEDTQTRDTALRLWGTRPALVFGSWKRQPPVATRAVLVWNKGGHAGMGDLSVPWKPNHEQIYVLGQGFTGPRTSGVLTGFHIVANETAGRTHPHEKPLSLMEHLLAKSPAGVVADPFAGSGTTLRAALNQGRRVIGVELEERYCELIAKRLDQDVLDFGEPA